MPASRYNFSFVVKLHQTLVQMQMNSQQKHNMHTNVTYIRVITSPYERFKRAKYVGIEILQIVELHFAS